jgi:hypothetical protein
MATQDADRPQGKKKRSIISGKLRTITIILCIIFALVGLIFWIIAINNDNTHIDKMMGAIFTFLTLVSAFLTIPFLVSSEEPRVATTSQIPAFQFNPTFNMNQTNAPQASGSIMTTGIPTDNITPTGQSTTPNNNAQPQQQAPAGTAPAPQQKPPSIPEPLPSVAASEDQDSEVDEFALLKKLMACPPSVLGAIANCIRLPVAWHLSDKADPANQANNLINWAKHPDGPGLEALYKCYMTMMGLEAGTGKKKSL